MSPLSSAHRSRSTVEALESRTLLTVPAGLTETRVATGLQQPVAMAFAPDGRLFITEKTGAVKVMTAAGQVLPDPFVRLTVNSEGERGALGVVFDPNYASNRHVYVYYTSTEGTIHNRLSRFTADAGNPNVMQAGSEVKLIEFPELGAIYHNAGNMHFGPDGKLYVAIGDNVRGAVAQQKTNLWGKIIRINPDGSIPADNPFYNETTGINRAIWAMGLRNAFTFAFQPGTGRMFINEVGNEAWEEVNEGRAGGNYGWPESEGPTTDPRFDSPLYAYQNNGVCNAVTGALFYDPAGGAGQLPAPYVGKYFFGDLCGGINAGQTGGWIKMLDPATGNVTDFGTNIQRPVDFDIGPDGSFYYLSNSRPGVAGHVYRVAPAVTAGEPNVVVEPSDLTASVGHPASFAVEAAGPGTLAYQWQRDGANIPGATAAAYTLPSATLADSGAKFRVVVSNAAGSVTSREATLTVTANQPPVPTITLPIAGGLFAGGQPVSYAGIATDAEDGDLPPGAFTWRVDYVTGGVARQAVPDTPGSRTGTFTPVTQTPFTGTDVVYRVVLTVRDSAGLEGMASVDLAPSVGTLNLATEPTAHGLRLTLDGQTFRDALAAPGVVGVQRVVVANLMQSVNGVNYVFSSWSDGSTAESRTVSTPAGSGTLTAIYLPVDDGTGDPAHADLASQVISAPPGLVHGGRGRVTVRLSNVGRTPIVGPVTVYLVASPDAYLDSVDDPVITHATKTVRLAPGKSRNVRLDFVVNNAVPQGRYRLLASAQYAGTLAETTEWNNVSASAAPVSIGPPTVDLVAGGLDQLRQTRPGPRTRVTGMLTLRNDGNIAYAGPVTVALFGSATPAPGYSVAYQIADTFTRKVRLRPGGRITIRVAAPRHITPGDYFLVARVLPVSVSDANPADNDAVSAGPFQGVAQGSFR